MIAVFVEQPLALYGSAKHQYSLLCFALDFFAKRGWAALLGFINGGFITEITAGMFKATLKLNLLKLKFHNLKIKASVNKVTYIKAFRNYIRYYSLMVQIRSAGNLFRTSIYIFSIRKLLNRSSSKSH